MKLLSLKIATPFFLVLFNTCCAQKATITFNVNLNPTGLTIKDTALIIRIKGDVEPLNWVEGIKMLDVDKDGVYSTTIDFDTKGKKELTFKYVLNDVEWETGENLKIEIKQNAKPYNSNFRYAARVGNPFKKFIGTWTLKDNNWEQGYGKDVERIKIPNHFTLCKEVNTDNSLLWIVESPNSKGHIFWSYNHVQKEVQWSSSFYSYRSGSGKGTLNSDGNLSFKVSFEGEPEATYRIYTYNWISNDEFELKSVQFDDKDQPPGGFYGGTFVRLNKGSL